MKKTDFKFIEFIQSQTAVNNHIKNVPDWDSITNLMDLVTDVLQPIRDFAGVPLYINSGYRCSELNKLVGGVSNSLHMSGRAVDFTSYSRETDDRIFRYLNDYRIFDQVIRYDNFIHVSYVKGSNKHQTIDCRKKK